MKKRIYLNEREVNWLPLTESETPGNPNPGTVDGMELSITFEGENIQPYLPTVLCEVSDASGKIHSQMNGWPEKEICIAIPAEDMPRIKSWFTGNYQGVESPASTTVMKNITNAINNLLEEYEDYLKTHNLFCSPSKLAWCPVFNDGTKGELSPLEITFPSPMPPVLLISNFRFTDTQLFTRVQIRNIPARAYYRIDCTEANLENLGSIEIYSTNPIAFHSSPTEIFGIKSVSIDGIPQRSWAYDKFTEAEIANFLSASSPYRKIATINAEGFAEDASIYKTIPIPSGVFSNFTKCEEYKTNPSEISPGGIQAAHPFLPATEPGRVHFETTPVSLGYPESNKRIRTVSLFGLFDRRESNPLTITLYGSHHREDWIKLVSSSRFSIGGMRASGFRWFKTEVETNLRKGDFLEGIAFEFSVS